MLEATYQNKLYICMIDTGAEWSIAPARLFPKVNLRPSFTGNLIAANGAILRVIGEADIPLQIGNRTILSTFQLSPNVGEVLLGQDWICQYNCIPDIRRGIAYIDGEGGTIGDQRFDEQLPQNNPNRRCDIPALSQYIVPARAELRTWRLS